MDPSTTTTLIRDRVRELRRVRAGDLLANPKNWRTHPKSQQDALRGILADVGFAGALLARELPDGTLQLIDGHLRTEEAAPDQLLPVLVTDLTEAEADKILATHDPLAAMAETDALQLDELLRSIEPVDDVGLQSLIADLGREVVRLSTSFDQHGPNDADAEWQGMPSFNQDDQLAKFAIKINFETEDDLRAFATLIGQLQITTQTRSVWHPAHARDDRTREYIVSES